MKLKVPLHKQAKESVACGLACLKMLLEYHKVKTSMKELKSKIKLYKGGAYSLQLANYLISKGFDVEIITLNPKLFTKKDENKKIDLIKRFSYLLHKKKGKKLKLLDRIGIKHFIKFVNNQGRIKIKIPDKKDIATEIKNKRPLLALLTTSFLKGDKPVFNFHYNIITGIDKEYVYVNDPLWDKRGGKYKYRIEDFFFGLYSSNFGCVDNGCLIKIKKKK